MFEDTFSPASISPALLSSVHTTPSLINDSVSTTSAVAMSSTEASSTFDATTPMENTCASCKKIYLVSSISDDSFCHDCLWFLENSEPKTQEEIELEKIVCNFSDDDIKAVGLGRFFELEDTLMAAAPQPVNTAPAIISPNSSKSSGSHAAQMAALDSQMQHQRKNSGGDPFLTSQYPNTTAIPSMPPPHSQFQGYPPSRPSMPVTEDTFRQWAIAQQSNSSIPAAATSHSRTESQSFPRSSSEYMRDIYESPSVQAEVKKGTRKRGKRMICATCEKDSPVSDKNDGVNCTRCFGKLKRAAVGFPISPDVGGEKRSWESALDGYSPADGSPSKVSKRF